MSHNVSGRFWVIQELESQVLQQEAASAAACDWLDTPTLSTNGHSWQAHQCCPLQKWRAGLKLPLCPAISVYVNGSFSDLSNCVLTASKSLEWSVFLPFTSISPLSGTSLSHDCLGGPFPQLDSQSAMKKNERYSPVSSSDKEVDIIDIKGIEDIGYVQQDAIVSNIFRLAKLASGTHVSAVGTCV